MTISENNRIINSLQFYYGTPQDNYKRFTKSYHPNFLLIKIIAIPIAVTMETIKIIFHIARAIFQGMFQFVKGNKLPLQADIYHVVRDLQCILGVILTIFNDKLGVYLVKNSFFQKSCYDNVIKDNVDLFEYMSDDQIKKLNLKDIEKYQLKSMFHIFMGDIGSKIKNKFANFSVEQVQMILLKLDDQEFSYISDDQLKELDLKNLSKGKLSDLFAWKWIGCDEMKKRFANLSFEQVQSILLKLDKDGLSYISDEQLKNLVLKDLSKEQLAELFPEQYPWVDNIKNRFASLSVEQVQSILLKLDKVGLSYISYKQLKGLNLIDLSKENIGILFPTLSKEGIREESKSRVLSENEVWYETLRRMKLNITRLDLLTDIQFNQIKDKLEAAILNLRK
jgi:hypothetical protein